MLSIKCLIILEIDLCPLYLHSTMLSIKFRFGNVKGSKADIYIPLCYLLNYDYSECSKKLSQIYIPLCYLLNKNSIKQGKKIYSIYIPLCYLLNYYCEYLLKIHVLYLHSTMLSIK